MWLTPNCNARIPTEESMITRRERTGCRAAIERMGLVPFTTADGLWDGVTVIATGSTASEMFSRASAGLRTQVRLMVTEGYWAGGTLSRSVLEQCRNARNNSAWLTRHGVCSPHRSHCLRHRAQCLTDFALSLVSTLAAYGQS